MTTDAPVPPPGDSPSSTATAVAPPPGGPPAATPAAGEPPSRRSGPVALLVALGVGLLAAATALSAVFSRYDDDLDWSNYAVGLGATAGLLVIGLGTAVLVRRRTTDAAPRGQVATWAIAAGVIGAAAMLRVAFGDAGDSYRGYLIGGVVVALSAFGFLLTRGGPVLATTILGLGILYANGVEDVLGDRLDDDHAASVVAGALAVFVVGVTVLGWLLPTRALSAQVAGWIGVAGLVGQLAVLLVGQFVGRAFASAIPADRDTVVFAGVGNVDTDVWVILAVAGGLTVLWAVGAALTDDGGLTLLAIVLPTLAAPMGTVALAAEHPTWWSAALAVPGGVLLALAALFAVRRGRRT